MASFTSIYGMMEDSGVKVTLIYIHPRRKKVMYKKYRNFTVANKSVQALKKSGWETVSYMPNPKRADVKKMVNLTRRMVKDLTLK